MSNLDIRTYAISKQVKHWRIAERLGKSDSNFQECYEKNYQMIKKGKLYLLLMS